LCVQYLLHYWSLILLLNPFIRSDFCSAHFGIPLPGVRCSIFAVDFFVAASIEFSSRLLGLLVRAPRHLSSARAVDAFILELKLFKSVRDFCLLLMVSARFGACDTVS
jgi:hypothetical protein